MGQGSESRSDQEARHWGLAGLLIVYALLSIAYSVLTPLGEGPDEVAHFDYVRFLAQHGRLPRTLEERREAGYKSAWPPLYHLLTALGTFWVDSEAVPTLKIIDEDHPRHLLARGGDIDFILHTEDEAFPYHDVALAWHLARFISILMGALTIVATYLIALEIFPANKPLALGAATVNALLPQFIYVRALVNDDNLVGLLSSWALFLLLKIVKGRWKLIPFWGLLIGLTFISKYSALPLFIEFILILALLWWRRRTDSAFPIKETIMASCGALLPLTGWLIYIEHRFHRMDQMGWMAGMLAPFAGPRDTTTAKILKTFSEPTIGQGMVSSEFEPFVSLTRESWLSMLFKSSWAFFNSREALMAEPIYWALAFLTLLSVLGLSVGLIRLWRKEREKALFLIGFVCHSALFLPFPLIRHFMTGRVVESAMGRHLFPAISALSILFFYGLAKLVGVRGIKPLILGLGLGLGSLSILCLLRCLVFAYPLPLPVRTTLPAPAEIPQPLDIRFGDEMELLGYGLSAPPFEPGRPLHIALYWRTLKPMDEDRLFSLEFRDEKESLCARWEGHPVQGRYPTRAWEPGDVIRDEWKLRLSPGLKPGRYRLRLGLRSPRNGPILPSTQSDEKSVSLTEIRVTGSPSITSPSRPLSLNIPDRIALLGYDLVDEGAVIGGNPTYRPRQMIQLDLYWRLEDDADKLPIISVAWLDVRGRIWREDKTPLVVDPCSLSGRRREISLDHRHYIVDAKATSGAYRLRIEAWEGDQLLGRVESEPILTILNREHSFDVPPISFPMSVNLGGELEFLGYDLVSDQVEPGDTLFLTLYWRALKEMAHSYNVWTHLLDNAQKMWGQHDKIPRNINTVLWAEGEVVWDQFRIPVVPSALSGRYFIEIGAWDRSLYRTLNVIRDGVETEDRVLIGPIKVMERLRADDVVVQHPRSENLDGKVRLLGYDLSSSTVKAGGRLRLTLYWQGLKTMDTDYTVFTHLLDTNGFLVAQRDNQPVGGNNPTSFWNEAEIVKDVYHIAIDPSTPAGLYLIEVGMYELSSGQRLPVLDERGEVVDNRILLGEVKVVK